MHEGGVVMSAAAGPGKELSFGLALNPSLFVLFAVQLVRRLFRFFHHLVAFLLS